MRITVVHAHPSPDSFNRAVFTTVCSALSHHTVDAFDLYADGFQPAMTSEERVAYHGDSPIIDPLVRKYADAVDAADALVFVYPTWWAGLPAIAKGWLDKVMVPGVGFGFDEHGRVEARLRHIRRLAGVTTYGSNRWAVALTTDGGRRTIMRALRISTAVRTKKTWLGLYAMDAATADDRARFLTRVEREFRSW